ncbi:hypothetical protein [Amycolatopsis sp. NPDC049159]
MTIGGSGPRGASRRRARILEVARTAPKASSAEPALLPGVVKPPA